MCENERGSGARPSVYERICRELKRDPGALSAFQNLATAGRTEAKLLLAGSEVAPSLQRRWAADMAEAVAPSTEAGAMLPELRARLRLQPLPLYSRALIERLRLLLDAGALDGDALFRFGAKLAREGASIPEVMLGMLLLAPFDNDISRRLVRTLALHGDLARSGAEAARGWRDGNRLLYELARSAAGYGKLTALYYLQPVEPEQCEWLFLHGMDGCADRRGLAEICLEKPDLRARLLAPAESEAAFHALSRWVAWGALGGSIPRAEGGAEIARGYLSQMGRFPLAWPDLAAAAMLLRALRENPNTDDSPWTMEDRGRIEDACAGLLDPRGRSARLLRAMQLEAMARADEDGALLLATLDELNQRALMEPPEFECFIPLLEAEAFGLPPLDYLLLRHPERYAGDVLQSLEFPEKLFSGPLALDEETVPAEYHPDLWLQCLLRAMRAAGLRDEALFLRCLGARWPGARREALTSLRAMKLDWSGAARPALEAALDAEPDAHIQKQIRRLLWNEGGKRGSEQRYVDVEGLGPRPGDIREPYMQTEIAGAFYRDMTVVRDRLGDGDGLLLAREPENPYDANAVLVTTEDGYVLGYIPRRCNAELAARMDAGERFAAVLRDSLDDSRPRVDVVRLRPIEREGNVIRLPGAERAWSEEGGLALDLGGLALRLRVATPGDPSEDSCTVDGSVDGGFIHYDIDGALMLLEELDGLIELVARLLRGELEEEIEIALEDPELAFRLFPAKLPGSAPVLELIVRLWSANGPLGGNRLTLVLDRPSAEALLDYLRFVRRDS